MESYMRPAKKTVLMLAAIAIGVTLLFPPFHFLRGDGIVMNYGYSFIFFPPNPTGDTYATVDAFLLLVQWLGILVVAGLFWLSINNDH